MIKPSSSRTQLEFVRQAIAAVPSTDVFRARDILERYPDLEIDHPTLVDLAYEEYCQAYERGEAIDHVQFASRFPEVETSLLMLLEVHSFIVGNSLLTDEETEAPWPTPGEEFLGFQLLEEIGKGAFSRVFLAREKGLGHRQVVVKISQRGEAEATMLGLLDHPNIVPIHSLTADEVVKLSALCMPYLGRTTATEWIQTRFKNRNSRRVRAVPHLQSVIEIGLGVCRGLQFAHEHNVLHCDVKPSNVLITHDGEPVLLDFNLSTDQANEKHLVGGTLMYMAPEQLLRALGDRTANITPATDVYCLGATLYQMATGQPAFGHPSKNQPRLNNVMEAALSERTAFLQRDNPLAEPLRSTLLDALAYEPHDRIATAQEFYARLLQCNRGLARPRKLWLRRAAVAGMVGLGIAAAYKGLGPESTPQQSINPPAPAPERVSPPPSQNPPLSMEDRLKIAQEAESAGRYAEAIIDFRTILEIDAEKLLLSATARQDVEHSLAFCLLMNHQILEANTLYAQLPKDFANESLPLNQAAGLAIACLEGDAQTDHLAIQNAIMTVRQQIPFHKEVAELHQIVGLLYLRQAKLLGKDEPIESRIQQSLQHIKRALFLGLSQEKALIAGDLLPEVKEFEPLHSIQEQNPKLEADREVHVPVQSPRTGKYHFIRITLP